MVEDFKQTVNLRDKRSGNQKSRPAARAHSSFKNNTDKKTAQFFGAGKKPSQKRAEQIDEVYNGEMEDQQDDLKKISRPAIKSGSRVIFKQLTIILIGIFILAMFYIAFKNKNSNDLTPVNTSEWYLIKLVNEEIYYGEISDTASDPIVLHNVYYNYDQINKEDKSTDASGNLRLVKRGKEAHGPDGSMNIVRAQVLFMEPLAPDSKVLEAILDYEK